MKKVSVYIVLLLFISALACKKMKVRSLVKNYEGDYIATMDGPLICFPRPEFEVTVKKSRTGCKIIGLASLEDFNVNDQDSSLSAFNTNTNVIASGKLHPNKSITIELRLPPYNNRHLYYRLKKIE